MIDTKSKLVLQILAKECNDGSYKIIEIPDIIMSLPRHFRLDSDSVRHILTHLERQDIISVKYDDDDVYCLAVLPYGFEILESEKPISLKKDKPKNWNYWGILLYFLAAFFGSAIGSALWTFIFSNLK